MMQAVIHSGRLVATSDERELLHGTENACSFTPFAATNVGILVGEGTVSIETCPLLFFINYCQ